jgi:nucleoid-associated protein YgaU
MAAVAHASPAEIRRLVLVRTTPLAVPAVALWPTTVHRRRRAVALLVVLSVAAALILSVQALLGSSGRGSVAASQAPAERPAAYVVQPGDTFWEIARRLRPHDDPRPLVARMVAEHGSPVLVAGERLPLPFAA